MLKNDILNLAKENLARSARFKLRWTKKSQEKLDTAVQLIMDNGRILAFNAEVKDRIGPQQVDGIRRLSDETSHFLLISGFLSAQTKEKLRNHNISYLEANGNLFIKDNNIFLWIESNKSIDKKGGKGNRAFAKAGLKTIFHFLLFPEWINLSYREIALNTGTSLGNVSNILGSLEDSGFLIRKSKTEFAWNNREQLLDKWISHYCERLKPSLSIGAFRFLKESQSANWKDITLQAGRTWWGGEPAADLLTNYLRPVEWTLYTKESKQDLIKNYQLIPDLKGPVRVYQAFWTFDLEQPTVPHLLVYADLVHTENSRCLETAQFIYQKYLHANF